MIFQNPNDSWLCSPNSNWHAFMQTNSYIHMHFTSVKNIQSLTSLLIILTQPLPIAKESFSLSNNLHG